MKLFDHSSIICLIEGEIIMTENRQILRHTPQPDHDMNEVQVINEPKVQVRAEQPYVSIPIEINLKEWDKANALVVEIFGWLGQKRVQPTGAPFFRYQVIGDIDKKCKIEVGVPVGNAISGDGHVIAGTIPAGKYVTLVHTGHPNRIANSYAILEEWASGRGMRWDNRMEDNEDIWAGRFEYYLTDPAEQPNPEQWSIEIEYLIEERAFAV